MDFDYIKLKTELLSLIRKGTYPSGSPIPSERELCLKYETSRTTVRRAINDLVDERHLIRKPGKGTFVSDETQGGAEKTDTILFLRCMHSPSFLSDDVIYPLVLAGVEESAAKSGYRCLVRSINENEPDYAGLDNFKGKIDGIICGELHRPEFYQYLTTFRLPLVLVSPSIEAEKADMVLIDNRMGARRAVHQLIGQGHKRIAMIGGSETSLPARERKEGFLQAMDEAGLDVDERFIVNTRWLQSDGYDSFVKLWQDPVRPTALFAASDLLALGVFNGAVKEGVLIPEELSLVGFDGIPLVSQLRPALTTMHVRARDMGETSFRLFLEQRKEGRNYHVKVTIPVELSQGESIGPCRE